MGSRDPILASLASGFLPLLFLFLLLIPQHGTA